MRVSYCYWDVLGGGEAEVGIGQFGGDCRCGLRGAGHGVREREWAQEKRHVPFGLPA